MATFDYAALRTKADTLIARFGQAALIRRSTDASGDDWDSEIVTTDYSCTGVVVDYANREIDGTLIQIGDRRAFLAAGSLSIDPTTADAFVWHGTAFKIVNVKPVEPAALAVVWELQVRG